MARRSFHPRAPQCAKGGRKRLLYLFYPRTFSIPEHRSAQREERKHFLYFFCPCTLSIPERHSMRRGGKRPLCFSCPHAFSITGRRGAQRREKVPQCAKGRKMPPFAFSFTCAFYYITAGRKSTRFAPLLSNKARLFDKIHPLFLPDRTMFPAALDSRTAAAVY